MSSPRSTSTATRAIALEALDRAIALERALEPMLATWAELGPRIGELLELLERARLDKALRARRRARWTRGEKAIAGLLALALLSDHVAAWVHAIAAALHR